MTQQQSAPEKLWLSGNEALALGARAVMVGRPLVYGLAAAGASGVAHVLHILRTELEMAMLLSGRPNIQAIDASALWSLAFRQG